MLHVRNIQHSTPHPSPLLQTPSFSTSHRPLGQCRQFASGDLQASQPFYGQNENNQIIYNNLCHSPQSECTPSAGEQHQDMYATMTNLLQTRPAHGVGPSSPPHNFTALFDSIGGSEDTIKNSYSYQFCSASSSSIAELEPPRSDSKAGAKRKRKRPYVPHVQRRTEVVIKRNARERRRMGTMQGAFKALQRHLPVVKHSCKRIPKEKLLRVATDYIRHLQTVLQHPALNGSDICQSSLTFLPPSPTVANADTTTPYPSLESVTSSRPSVFTVPSSVANNCSADFSPLSAQTPPLSYPLSSSPISSTSSTSSAASCSSPTTSLPALTSICQGANHESQPSSENVDNRERPDSSYLTPAEMDNEEFGFLDKDIPVDKLVDMFLW